MHQAPAGYHHLLPPVFTSTFFCHKISLSSIPHVLWSCLGTCSIVFSSSEICFLSHRPCSWDLLCSPHRPLSILHPPSATCFVSVHFLPIPVRFQFHAESMMCSFVNIVFQLCSCNNDMRAFKSSGQYKCCKHKCFKLYISCKSSVIHLPDMLYG